MDFHEADAAGWNVYDETISTDVKNEASVPSVPDDLPPDGSDVRRVAAWADDSALDGKRYKRRRFPLRVLLQYVAPAVQVACKELLVDDLLAVPAFYREF